MHLTAQLRDWVLAGLQMAETDQVQVPLDILLAAATAHAQRRKAS